MKSTEILPVIVFVRITADVHKDASWLPADGITGLESELKDLISKSIKDCLDGIDVTLLDRSMLLQPDAELTDYHHQEVNYQEQIKVELSRKI